MTAMDDDDIKKVDEWFDLHTENYGTYHADNDYAVCEWDLEAFSDFLREEFHKVCPVYGLVSKVYKRSHRTGRESASSDMCSGGSETV